MNKIAEFIKENRKAAGLTQEEFAARSGLGLRFIRELEQGKETVRMDKVYVYIRNVFSGTLCESDEGYSFSYDEQYLTRKDASPVSLTLPLSEKTYTSKTLFPFFDGLIPEGWLLGVVSRNWKIDVKDRFGLLLVACKDGIGNVNIREERI